MSDHEPRPDLRASEPPEVDRPAPTSAGTSPAVPLGPAEGDGTERRSRTAVVAALVVLVVAVGVGTWFAAGDGGGDDRGDGSAGGSPDGGSGPSGWGIRWEVVGITERGEPRPVVSARGAALAVDLGVDGRISFTGCNGGSGTGRVADGTLVIDDGFSATEMACTGPEGEALMAQDAWLAEFLSSTPAVEVGAGRDGEAETLRLTTEEATMELVSRGPAPDPAAPAGGPDEPVSNDPDAPNLPDPGQGSVVPTTPDDGADGSPGGSVGGGTGGAPGTAGVWGQRWTITTITSLPSTPGSVGSVVVARPATDGAAPVLDLSTDGRVSFTGCNGGTSAARLDGDRLLVDGVVATRKACIGPDGEALMAQDALLTEILESGPTVRLDGATIGLSSGVGAIEATREG